MPGALAGAPSTAHSTTGTTVQPRTKRAPDARTVAGIGRPAVIGAASPPPGGGGGGGSGDATATAATASMQSKSAAKTTTVAVVDSDAEGKSKATSNPGGADTAAPDLAGGFMTAVHQVAPALAGPQLHATEPQLKRPAQESLRYTSTAAAGLDARADGTASQPRGRAGSPLAPQPQQYHPVPSSTGIMRQPPGVALVAPPVSIGAALAAAGRWQAHVAEAPGAHQTGKTGTGGPMASPDGAHAVATVNRHVNFLTVHVGSQRAPGLALAGARPVDAEPVAVRTPDARGVDPTDPASRSVRGPRLGPPGAAHDDDAGSGGARASGSRVVQAASTLTTSAVTVPVRPYATTDGDPLNHRGGTPALPVSPGASGAGQAGGSASASDDTAGAAEVLMCILHSPSGNHTPRRAAGPPPSPGPSGLGAASRSFAWESPVSAVATAAVSIDTAGAADTTGAAGAAGARSRGNSAVPQPAEPLHVAWNAPAAADVGALGAKAGGVAIEQAAASAVGVRRKRGMPTLTLPPTKLVPESLTGVAAAGGQVSCESGGAASTHVGVAWPHESLHAACTREAAAALSFDLGDAAAGGGPLSATTGAALLADLASPMTVTSHGSSTPSHMRSAAGSRLSVAFSAFPVPPSPPVYSAATGLPLEFGFFDLPSPAQFPVIPMMGLPLPPPGAAAVASDTASAAWPATHGPAEAERGPPATVSSHWQQRPSKRRRPSGGHRRGLTVATAGLSSKSPRLAESTRSTESAPAGHGGGLGASFASAGQDGARLVAMSQGAGSVLGCQRQWPMSAPPAVRLAWDGGRRDAPGYGSVAVARLNPRAAAANATGAPTTHVRAAQLLQQPRQVFNWSASPRSPGGASDAVSVMSTPSTFGRHSSVAAGAATSDRNRDSGRRASASVFSFDPPSFPPSPLRTAVMQEPVREAVSLALTTVAVPADSDKTSTAAAAFASSSDDSDGQQCAASDSVGCASSRGSTSSLESPPHSESGRRSRRSRSDASSSSSKRNSAAKVPHSKSGGVDTEAASPEAGRTLLVRNSRGKEVELQLSASTTYSKGHPLCRVGGCTSRARYGRGHGEAPTVCATHGKLMKLVDVYKAVCSVDGCVIEASWGRLVNARDKRPKRELCTNHARENNERVDAEATAASGAPTKPAARPPAWTYRCSGVCEVSLCETIAKFGHKGEAKRRRCATHAEKGMVNISTTVAARAGASSGRKLPPTHAGKAL